MGERFDEGLMGDIERREAEIRRLKNERTSIFEEIGVAIAGVEADANAHGLTGQMLGARDCLRAVAAIREKYLAAPSSGDSKEGG